MNKTKLSYRMYGLVPYNISPIQSGIQFGHAVVEYSNAYFNELVYQKWARVDKTFYILNGGTTNKNDPTKLGSMNVHRIDLLTNNIEHATFYEPDLGDQLTAIVWLADERIWDKETYPDFDENICLTEDDPYKEWTKQFFTESEEELTNILFLRNFQRKFRLA